MTVRVGLVGAGIMGADHARVLATQVAGAALAAVADPDAGRVAALRAAHPGLRTLAEPLDLVRDPGVDAVLVASPDATHAALVRACLEAGKPVLCEKPLAPTPEACLELVALEAAGGRRRVTVGYMRRFDPGYVELRRRVAEGALGAPLLMRCVHRNASAPPYVTPATIVTNAAVHEIDAARFVLGREVRWVTAVPRRGAGGATVDAPQLLLLELEGGVQVDAEIFMNARYGYDVRAEVVCERGVLALTPPHDLVALQDGQGGFAFPGDFRPRFARAYVAELQAWIAAVAAGAAAGASAWDGYVATAVAAAGVRSLELGAPVEVQLAPRPALYGGQDLSY